MNIKELLTNTNEQIIENDNLRLEFVRIFQAEEGVNLCAYCPGALKNALNLTRRNLQIIIPMNNLNFKFNAHALCVENVYDHITINQINTDEKAMLFLQKDKKRAKYFAKLPDDWEAQVDAFEAPEGLSYLKAPIQYGVGKPQAKPIVVVKDKTKEELVAEPGETPPPPADSEKSEDEQIIDSLKDKTKEELVAWASANELPEGEWKGLNKKELLTYCISRV